MSSGKETTQEQMEGWLTDLLQKTWRESKLFPNHPSAVVSFEWTPETTVPTVRITPKSVNWNGKNTIELKPR